MLPVEIGKQMQEFIHMGLETFMQRILRKFERFIDKKLIFDAKFSFNGFQKIQKNSKFKNSKI